MGNGVAASLFARSVLPSRDPDARHQPAQIPLPSTRVGLVEVVQVKDQLPLGRRVEAEVAQMCIATDNRSDARSRQSGEVLGHDRGGAAKERIRRGHHAAHPDRYEPLQSPFVRLHDVLHRVATAGRSAPSGQRRPGYLLP